MSGAAEVGGPGVAPTPGSQPSPILKIRVLIVDDHAVVRQGLRTFIDLQEDMEVVGEAANGLEAVAAALQFRPDVVLLDLVMPELGGVEATPRILANSPASRVLILTSFGEDDKVFPALRAGAQGYLLKDIRPGDLVQAVREAYRGKVQLHPDVAGKLVSAVAGAKPQDAGLARGTLGDLTEREQEVLELIAQGLNNREIADRITVSEKTVKTHVSSILGKLGVDDRTQAAIWALKHGFGSE